MEPSPKPGAPNAGRLHRSFFVVMTVALVLVVLVGFSRTFYLRPLLGLPEMPAYLYLHGAILTSWFALLAVQVWLVRKGSAAIHRRIGPYGAALAVAAVAVSPLTLALRDAHSVDDSPSRSFGNLMSLVGFTLCVGAGVAVRHRPAAHKRLILLGSILITAPALDRAGRLPALQPLLDPLLPDAMGSTGVAYAAVTTPALMLVVVGYDLVTSKRPHAATVAELLAIWVLGAGIAAALIGSGA